MGVYLSSAARAADQPAPPPAAPLSGAALDQLYQTELGSAFDAARLPRYRLAHDLLEQYFAADSNQRKQIEPRIETLGLPAQIIGRLARIRSSWTALDPGVYFINFQSGPISVRYFLGIPPNYDPTRSWPLVEKLPVANAFLTNPPPAADAVTKIYSQWMTQELSAHPDAVLVMPLLNLDELYGPGPVGMNLAMQPIFDAVKRANIDPARVYLTGHSMAAHAVWNLAVFYPTFFAAINPMAGAAHNAWQRVRLANLKNILAIVWADASDDVVNVDESRSIVHYLQRINYDVDYTETRDLGHQPSPQIIEAQYEKMRSRVRDLYPAQVFLQSNSDDTVYNRADWLQIYQPLTPGEQARVNFSRGSQGMYLYANTFRASAQITDRHTIKLDVKNVRLLRLYLNEQMLDLDNPIRVVIAGQTRFESVVPRSIDEILKDQLFLGRGWRYYTALIDLDLTQQPTATRPAGASASPGSSSHAPIEYTAPDGTKKVFIPKGE
jgi:hypothetical protein